MSAAIPFNRALRRVGKIIRKAVLLVFVSVLLLSSVFVTLPPLSASMDTIGFDLALDSKSLTIDWNHYHNYTEIVDILLSLNATYPNIVDVFSIGKSWQNRTIYCVRLTSENATYSKPKVMFVGYHHARERISAELPLYFVVYAAQNYGANTTVTRMLDLSEIYVVVALNVDGFDAVDVNEWQRKNVRPFDEDNDGLFDEDPPDDEDGDGYIEDLAQWNGTDWIFIRLEGIDDDCDGALNEDWIGGVDINRNYGYEWNATCESGSLDPHAEDYRGPAPFSEPETQAIRNLALQHDFKYAISFHSGDECIVYPWGYTIAPPDDEKIFIEMAEELSRLVECMYEQSGAWYTISGAWGDWMYGNRSTLALTCEIYTNGSAWQYEPGSTEDFSWEKGVFQFFNPDPNNIESTLQRWMPVFFYISNKAITHQPTTFLGLDLRIWAIIIVVVAGAATATAFLSHKRKTTTTTLPTEVQQ